MRFADSVRPGWKSCGEFGSGSGEAEAGLGGVLGWNLEDAAKTGFGIALTGTGTELAGKLFHPGRALSAEPHHGSPDGLLGTPDRILSHPHRGETGTGVDILGQAVARGDDAVRPTGRMRHIGLAAGEIDGLTMEKLYESDRGAAVHAA